MTAQCKQNDRLGNAHSTSFSSGYYGTNSGLADVPKKKVDINSLTLPGKNKIYIVNDSVTGLYKIGISKIPRFTVMKISKELKRDIKFLAVGLFINHHFPYMWFTPREKHPELDEENKQSSAHSWIKSNKKLDLLIKQLKNDPYFLEKIGKNEAIDEYQ